MMKRIKGFSWLEFFIVVAVVVILGAFAVPKFLDLVKDSKTAAAKEGAAKEGNVKEEAPKENTKESDSQKKTSTKPAPA